MIIGSVLTVSTCNGKTTVNAGRPTGMGREGMERSGRCASSPGSRVCGQSHRSLVGAAGNRDKARAAVEEDDDHGVDLESPGLIFFAEKNRGAEAELLVSSAWREVDWNNRATVRCLDELRSVEKNRARKENREEEEGMAVQGWGKGGS
jgi:hypothetical protein